MKFFLLCLLSLLLACQRAPLPPATTQKVLRLNVTNEPTTWDPRKTGDAVSAVFHFLLYEGLVRSKPDGSLAYALANHHTLSDDGCTYTFFLKEAYWASDIPITAYDFEASWKSVLEPNFPAPSAYLFYPILHAKAAKTGELPLSAVGIRALDAKTLQVKLEYPTPFFLELLSFCAFFPLPHTLLESTGSIEKNLEQTEMCSGPFRLAARREKDEICLIKNPFYHAKDKICLDNIHFSTITSEITALQLFEKGELDLLGYPITAIPRDAIKDLKARNLLQQKPTSAFTFCTFNTQTFPFHNMHLRKAFALAIQREEIVQQITGLGEQAALELVPPILKAGRTTPFFQDGDIEQARYFLQLGLEEEQLTLADLESITLYYSPSESHAQIAQTLQQQWLKNLGVRIQLALLEKKIFVESLAQRNYQLALTFLVPQYGDAMSILERFKYGSNVKNYTAWEETSYQKCLEDSFFARESRQAVLKQAETIFMEAMPIAPLFYWSAVFLAQPRVKNVQIAPLGGIFFETIDIEL